jgi:hypothetical protein
MEDLARKKLRILSQRTRLCFANEEVICKAGILHHRWLQWNDSRSSHGALKSIFRTLPLTHHPGLVVGARGDALLQATPHGEILEIFSLAF